MRVSVLIASLSCKRFVVVVSFYALINLTFICQTFLNARSENINATNKRKQNKKSSETKKDSSWKAKIASQSG